MILYKLLQTACLLCTAQSFHVDDGCEAKSEWTMEVRWDEFHFGAWVSSGKTDIMEIKAHFQGYEKITYYDKTVISKDNYDITKMRDLVPISKSHNIFLEIKDGWNDFFFQVDDNDYSIFHINKNGNARILNEEIDLKLESISVKGSNITINCPTKLHTWYVSKRPVVVPLDDSERHLLSFYSTGIIMPSITLGRREYPLGERDNKTSTLDGASPLRPFILHNITITCSSNNTIICIIQDTHDYGHELEEVRLSNRPEEVLVKKGGASSFFVILFEDNTHLSLQDEDISTVIPEPVGTNNMIVTAITSFLCAAALLVAIEFGCYCRRLLKEKLHPHTGLTKDAKRTTIDIDTTESELDSFKLNTPSRQVTLEGDHSKQYTTSLSKAEAPLLKSNRAKVHTTFKEKENL